MFVKFSCGCIGIPSDVVRAYGTSHPLIVKHCDGDGELSWSARDMGDKTSVPLTDAEAFELHSAIAVRFAAARRYDELRSTLRRHLLD